MKILGFVILLISIANTIVVVFSYRDFSIYLVVMFLITSVGYPLASILLTKKYFNYPITDDQEIEVRGLFSIGNPN
tara:strand:- start:123 stop:350 length:228 start_codon:yes stop_codon:yes gene_type:complete